MANFEQQIEKAKQLNPDKNTKSLFKFISSIEKQILDKNKEQLFENSQDVHGQAIGFYSKATDELTNGKKEWGTPFTGKDTGDLFKQMYMQEVSGVIRFGSKSPHYADILKSKSWLSKDIFGLTDKNLKQLIETELKPFIIANYQKILEI